MITKRSVEHTTCFVVPFCLEYNIIKTQNAPIQKKIESDKPVTKTL